MYLWTPYVFRSLSYMFTCSHFTMFLAHVMISPSHFSRTPQLPWTLILLFRISVDPLPFWRALKRCSFTTHSQPTDTIRHSSPTRHDYSPLFATPQWPKSPGPPLACLDPNRDNHVILPFPHSATLPLYLVHVCSLLFSHGSQFIYIVPL